MNDELLNRLTELERTVCEIHKKIELLQAEIAAQKSPEMKPPPDISPTTKPDSEREYSPSETRRSTVPMQTQPKKKTISDFTETIRKSEFWLNKIGITLFLLSIVFLFKYSVDQGWLKPWVRIGFGAAMGVGLIVLGMSIYVRRYAFAQVLFGGGIGAFYITGFAAFQLYSLLPHSMIFVFMIFVTLLAFILSIWQNDSILTIIGTAGGLAIPFLLYTHSVNLPGLVSYTCLLCVGAVAVYYQKGWRALFWVTFVGVWIVFLIGLITLFSISEPKPMSDKWSLQGGVVFAWLVFSVVPAVREIIRESRALRKKISEAEIPQENIQTNAVTQTAFIHLQPLFILSAAFAVLFSIGIWHITYRTWGWVTISGAGLYGIISLSLVRWNFGRYCANTYRLIAAGLLAVSFILLLNGEIVLFLLAVEAAAIHTAFYIVRKRGAVYIEKILPLLAHCIFAGVGIWLFYWLTLGYMQHIQLFTIRSITILLIIVMAAGIIPLLAGKNVRRMYGLIAHCLFLFFLYCVLAFLINGQGIVSFVWGVYSIVLLILGLRYRIDIVRKIAMATLLLVVGKLFIIDLIALKAIWRIVLFLALGSLLLIISYYINLLTRGKIPETK